MNDTDNIKIAPPYYAVVFTSQRTDVDPPGYEKMVLLAKKQEGFLGVDSLRDTNCAGITVSYWKDIPAIKVWKNQIDHLLAQKDGKSKWYSHYNVRIARVEKDYEFVKK
jgi:heme-degrading monooxygenase HmoA